MRPGVRSIVPRPGASARKIGSSRCTTRRRVRRSSGRSRVRARTRRRSCRSRRSRCPRGASAFGAGDVVDVVRVAAVDDRVARGEVRGDLVDDRAGDARRAPSATPRAAVSSFAARSATDVAPTAPFVDQRVDRARCCGRTRRTRGPRPSSGARGCAPMRPSPIIPSCMSTPVGRERRDVLGRRASAAPTMPARLPSSAMRTSQPGSMRSRNRSACLTMPPPITMRSGHRISCSCVR